MICSYRSLIDISQKNNSELLQFKQIKDNFFLINYLLSPLDRDL